jgi:hypothetical protein
MKMDSDNDRLQSSMTNGSSSIDSDDDDGHEENGTQRAVAMQVDNVFDSLLKAASVCDKFFNCAYVTKQLEDEWQQEKRQQNSAVGRVWNKMERSLEVEIYRQFLFDESSVDAEDPSNRESKTEPLLASLLYCGKDDDTMSIPELTRTRS